MVEGLAMIGKSITRKEELRLLTGRGSYVEDVQMPGLLHVSFFRSPHAATTERAEAARPAITEMARRHCLRFAVLIREIVLCEAA